MKRVLGEMEKTMQVTQYLAKDLYKGKTVFVTGGGSGINLGVAKNFAALGAKVCPVVADVRDYAALEAAFARSCEELGPMDVLVCGAAGNFLVPAEKLSPNGFKSVIDIDLLGSFNASRAAFEQLQATRGSLIFISAGMAYMPHAFQAHVGAAKAGIDMLMKNLAIEWGRHGIRANSIVPDPIEGRRLASRGWSRSRRLPLSWSRCCRRLRVIACSLYGRNIASVTARPRMCCRTSDGRRWIRYASLRPATRPNARRAFRPRFERCPSRSGR